MDVVHEVDNAVRALEAVLEVDAVLVAVGATVGEDSGAETVLGAAVEDDVLRMVVLVPSY